MRFVESFTCQVFVCFLRCCYFTGVAILVGSYVHVYFGTYCASAFGFYTVSSICLRFDGSILGLLSGLASLLFILALFVRSR